MTNEEAAKILRRIQEPEAWEPQINGAAFEALDMAIEALGRQQAAGSKDLISRSSLLAKYDEQHEGPPGRARKLIEDEPPVLGTNLAEVGTDLISRQALLDKFEPWLKVKDYNDGELNMLKAILYEIRFMRSVQPETATITIGRTKGDVTMWYECDACGEPIDICDCYCRKCGRKLKHETD